MTTRLLDIKFAELNPTLRVLSDAGVTTSDFDWIRGKANAEKVAAFLREARGLADQNPFAISVDETLKRLSLSNIHKVLGFDLEEAVMRLAQTAPEWPKGNHAFRSLRIRGGEAQEGVAKTFEAHFTCTKKEFGEKSTYHWEHLRSDKDRLRLLNGNDTHKPVVEWATLDLDANRGRKSIEAVRGKLSLADEGLAFTWLFPEYVKAIDYEKNPAFFLAGYELNVPGRGVGPWRRVPCVYWDRDGGRVCLSACLHGGGGVDFSVPLLRE